MVETISPAVHGGRNRSYWLSIALHVIGATMSAAAFGALLGGVGALVQAPWGITGAIVIGLAALVYLAREVFRLPVPTFDRKRQVPGWWRNFYSKPVASLLYGLGLGVGFLTYLTFGTYVVVAGAALVSGDPGAGSMLTGAFGAARALAVVVASGSTDTFEEPGALATGRVGNASALALVALGALLPQL